LINARSGGTRGRLDSGGRRRLHMKCAYPLQELLFDSLISNFFINVIVFCGNLMLAELNQIKALNGWVLSSD
jgi:hypothetical protein